MDDRTLLELARTKSEAIARGVSRYFTGKPCKRGHVCLRVMPTGVCIECKRLTNNEIYARDKVERNLKIAAYRAKNKELIRERWKLYYEKNKERRSFGYKQYRANNLEKDAARHILYRKENAEASAARERQYRLANPEKLRVKSQRRRARLSGAQGSFTAQDIQCLVVLQRRCCANCRKKLRDFHIDHIEPLSRGGSNWPANPQLLCKPCNLRKHAKSPERWAKEQGRLL